MNRAIKSLGRNIFICLTAFILLFPLSAVAHVNLSLPNGGEQLQVGGSYTIIWVQNIYHTTNNYDLFYSTSGLLGPWIELALDIAVIDGMNGTVHNYNWTIPNDLSNQVRVRVFQDNPGFDYFDVSDGDMAIVDTTLVSCCDLPGDFNGDGSIDISDLTGPTSIVAFMFQGGPSPICLAEGDFNGDGSQDISDLTGPSSMVAYMFQSGPAPVCGP